MFFKKTGKLNRGNFAAAITLVLALLLIASLILPGFSVRTSAAVFSLKSELKTLDDKNYTVTVTFDSEEKVPGDLSLEIKELNIEPEDLSLPENRKRPYKSERFVSAEEFGNMTKELKESLNIKADETPEFLKFLDINLISDGIKFIPQYPVKVTIMTDALTQDDTSKLRIGARIAKARKEYGEKPYRPLGLTDPRLSYNTDRKTISGEPLEVQFKTTNLDGFGLIAVPLKTEEGTDPSGEGNDPYEDGNTKPEEGSGEDSGTEESGSEPAEDVYLNAELIRQELKEREEAEGADTTDEEELLSMPAMSFEAVVWDAGGIGTGYGKAPDPEAVPEEYFQHPLVIVRVEAGEGALPEGTLMTVTEVTQDPSVRKAVSSAVNGRLSNMQSIDIAFYNADGEAVQPKQPVKVTIISDIIELENLKGVSAPLIVHLTKDGEAKVIKPEGEKEPAAEEEPFEEPEADEENVWYDSITGQWVHTEAPRVELNEETTGEKKESAEDGEFLETIVSTEEETTAADETAAEEVPEENQQPLNELSFMADYFSVYAIAYTVNFHWGSYTYSMEGDREILLSELLEKAGVVDFSIGDVQSVSFSNEDLVKVEELEGDFRLSSLKPFTSEEFLTINLKDEASIEIRVTDALAVDEADISGASSVPVRYAFANGMIVDGAEIRMPSLIESGAVNKEAEVLLRGVNKETLEANLNQAFDSSDLSVKVGRVYVRHTDGEEEPVSYVFSADGQVYYTFYRYQDDTSVGRDQIVAEVNNHLDERSLKPDEELIIKLSLDQNPSYSDGHNMFFVSGANVTARLAAEGLGFEPEFTENGSLYRKSGENQYVRIAGVPFLYQDNQNPALSYQGLIYEVSGSGDTKSAKVTGREEGYEGIPTVPAILPYQDGYPVRDLSFFGSGEALKGKSLLFSEEMLHVMAGGAETDLADMIANLSGMDSGMAAPVKDPRIPVDLIFGIDESGEMSTVNSTRICDYSRRNGEENSPENYTLSAPRLLWLMALLQDTASELISGNNGTGLFDLRLAFVPWGSEEIAPVSDEDFLGSKEAIDSFFAGEKAYSHAAEGSRAGTMCEALSDAAELSKSRNRTPVVISLSEFESLSGSEKSQRELLKNADYKTYAFSVYNNGPDNCAEEFSNARQAESSDPSEYSDILRELILYALLPEQEEAPEETDALFPPFDLPEQERIVDIVVQTDFCPALSKGMDISGADSAYTYRRTIFDVPYSKAAAIEKSCALIRENIARLLPEYETELLFEIQEEKLIFTIRAALKTADIHVEKTWEENSAPKKNASATFVLVRADGEPFYETVKDEETGEWVYTGKRIEHKEITLRAPEGWNGSDPLTGVFEGIPVQKSAGGSEDERYVIYEQDLGDQFTTTYSDTSGNPENLFVNDAASNPEQATFRLSEEGIRIRAVDSSWNPRRTGIHVAIAEPGPSGDPGDVIFRLRDDLLEEGKESVLVNKDSTFDPYTLNLGTDGADAVSENALLKEAVRSGYSLCRIVCGDAPEEGAGPNWILDLKADEENGFKLGTDSEGLSGLRDSHQGILYDADSEEPKPLNGQDLYYVFTEKLEIPVYALLMDENGHYVDKEPLDLLYGDLKDGLTADSEAIGVSQLMYKREEAPSYLYKKTGIAAGPLRAETARELFSSAEKDRLCFQKTMDGICYSDSGSIDSLNPGTNAGFDLALYVIYEEQVEDYTVSVKWIGGTSNMSDQIRDKKVTVRLSGSWRFDTDLTQGRIGQMADLLKNNSGETFIREAEKEFAFETEFTMTEDHLTDDGQRWEKTIYNLPTAYTYSVEEVKVEDLNTGKTLELSDLNPEYLYFTKEDRAEIRNTIHVDGGEIAFRVHDGAGEPLDDAVFTLYSDYTCQDEILWIPPVQSKTDRAELNGKAGIYKGIVRFENIPAGIYFLKEEESTGFSAAGPYVLIVGKDYMSEKALKALNPVMFADITQADLDKQNFAQITDGMKESQKEAAEKGYAIFRIEDKKAVRGEDIVNNGLMNTSRIERKVILRMPAGADELLPGTEFNLYNYDRTVRETSIPAPRDDMDVFFIDSLPLGTYYFVETAATAKLKNNQRIYYQLDVTTDEISISGPLESRPEQPKEVVSTATGFDPFSNKYLPDQEPGYSIELSQEEDRLYVVGDEGVTAALKVVTEDSESYPDGVIWTTSDPSVATIDESGVLTFEGPGQVTIIADRNGKRAFKEITVHSLRKKIVFTLKEDPGFGESDELYIMVNDQIGKWSKDNTAPLEFAIGEDLYGITYTPYGNIDSVSRVVQDNGGLTSTVLVTVTMK